MKETRIMKIFEQYIKKFDMNKGNIKSMYFHSLKMMELCKDIATSLGIFNEEEIILCELIGLFHDIGSFSQKRKSCILDDEDQINKTIDILFEKDKLIREIIEDTKYDDIIKLSIYCQNKIGLPKGVDNKTLHYCMIIKDAHVIETFRMITNYPYMDMHIDNYPNDLVYNDFRKFKVVNSKVSDNDADKILEVMSLVFGIYYTYSFRILKEELCVNKLVSALKMKNKTISKFFYQIASVMNMYIDKKIEGK